MYIHDMIKGSLHGYPLFLCYNTYRLPVTNPALFTAPVLVEGGYFCVRIYVWTLNLINIFVK